MQDSVFKKRSQDTLVGSGGGAVKREEREAMKGTLSSQLLLWATGT